ncbi:lysophospholipase [Candidatus Dojkabacteria bacterium]|nr:lysophospholipase [Candidatus Dojkabacteria bacterium]
MSEFYFKAKDNTRICYESEAPAQGNRTLLIVHGAGEYPGHYQDLFTELKKKGIGYYAIHHRGLGKSEGRRGHVNKFQDYADDLYELTQIAVEEGNKPEIIFGHSMGGLIALYYVLQNPDAVRKIILSAPALKIIMPVPLWVKAAKRPVSALWPTFTKKSGLFNNSDPLFVNVGSARWLVQFEKTQKYVLNKAGKITIPIRLFHSKLDTRTSFEASKNFFRSLGSKDKKFFEKNYNGHHFLLDPDKEEKQNIIESILNWTCEDL